MPPDAGNDRSLDWEKTQNAPFQQGRNHLLVIGIDVYADDRIADLKNAREDAVAVADLLREKYAFEGEEIRLFNADASRARIYEALDHYTDCLSEEDNLLIFFSGHGYFRKNQNRGYLVPADAQTGAFHTFLSNTVLLEDYLPGIRARHVVLIVDSCFSGSLFKDLNQESLTHTEQNIRNMMLSRSRLGIAAGSIELVSDGLVGNHSPFAGSLIHQLRENQRSYLPVLDLFHPVSQMTTYSADQRPVYGVLAKSHHVPGAQFVLTLKRDEARDWAAAQAQNSIEAYRRYRTAYPQGTHADEAAWQMACLLDSEGGYDDYLDQYPQGRYASEALARLSGAEERSRWMQAQARNTLSAYWGYLQHYPAGLYADEALARIAAIRAAEQEQADAEKAANEEARIKAAKEQVGRQEQAKMLRAREYQAQLQRETEELLRRERDRSSKEAEEEMAKQKSSFTLSEMIRIPGGIFQMGEGKGEHTITLDSFEIGKYLVTQRQWQAIMGNNPSHFQGDDLPVENVSWNECQAFIKKLNAQTGQQYRLPTEAEWEYAAGGGEKNRTRWAGTNDEKQLGEYAWYRENSGDKTHQVGQKKPNELGLYDMSGNVWEWCADWYGDYPSGAQTNPQGPSQGSFRVNRGGSWDDTATFCRVAYRIRLNPVNRYFYLGFRLAR